MSENTEVPVTTTTVAPVEEKAPKAKKPKAAKSHPFQPGESGILTKAQRAHVVLVTDENDLLYNGKIREPEDMSDTLADDGWLPTNPLTLMPDGRIFAGRMKWLSLDKAEKRAKREIEVPYVVLDVDEERAADITVITDFIVKKINPMLVAEAVFRLYSRGLSPKEIQKRTKLSQDQQDGYLLILDEQKCPPEVQQLLRDGDISFAGALELARRADKLTAGEVKKAAEEMAKAAAGGVRLTAQQVKKAAGVQEGSPATSKQKKQMILDLNSADLKGKHGNAVQWAAIVGLEVALGTRTVDSAWVALKKLAQGQTIKVEFKQYHASTDRPDKDE